MENVNADGVVVWVLVLVVVVVTAAVDDGHGSLEAGSGERTINALAASEMYSFRPIVTFATV